MSQGSEYGRRISEREYADRIAGVYARVTDEIARGMPQDDASRRARNAELDATIDFRLGVGFPALKRAAIRSAQEAVEAARGRLVNDVTAGHLPPSEIPARAQALAAELRRRLADVLTAEELESFLGDGELPFPAPDQP